MTRRDPLATLTKYLPLLAVRVVPDATIGLLRRWVDHAGNIF